MMFYFDTFGTQITERICNKTVTKLSKLNDWRPSLIAHKHVPVWLPYLAIHKLEVWTVTRPRVWLWYSHRFQRPHAHDVPACCPDEQSKSRRQRNVSMTTAARMLLFRHRSLLGTTKNKPENRSLLTATKPRLPKLCHMRTSNFSESHQIINSVN